MTKKAAYQKTDLTAKIVVVNAENPCRTGTAVHRRVAAVLRANGKPVLTAVKAGARTSTVRWAVAHKLVRLTAAPARKVA